METIVFLERDTLRADLRPPAFEHRRRDYCATARRSPRTPRRRHRRLKAKAV